MYATDAIAHEYEFGNGDHMAASRTQFDWFLYQAGMLTFRVFCPGQGNLEFELFVGRRQEPRCRSRMKNLAISQVMVGANFWDAPGHSMAGSNDLETRKQIFAWIQANENVLYTPRKAMHPVGVYFSPKSRDSMRRKNFFLRIEARSCYRCSRTENFRW